MRRVVIAGALAVAVAAPLRAGVEVTVAEGRLDVRAARAPVAEVLDGLARKTRMKVVYEGSRPYTLVSVDLRGRTPAQAVLGVLEGLGLNYALILNAAGTEVETLMIVGAGAASTSPTPVRATGGSSRQRVPDTQPDFTPEPEPEPVEEMRPAAEPHEVVPEPPKPTPPPFGPLNPTGMPTSPFAPVPPPQQPPPPSPTPAPSPSPNVS